MCLSASCQHEPGNHSRTSANLSLSFQAEGTGPAVTLDPQHPSSYLTQLDCSPSSLEEVHVLPCTTRVLRATRSHPGQTANYVSSRCGLRLLVLSKSFLHLKPKLMSAPQRCVEVLNHMGYGHVRLSLACQGCWRWDFSHKIRLQKHFPERQERSVVSTVGSEGN